MPYAPDYSQYIAVKKITTAQTVNANTSIVKSRAPPSYNNPFPLYKAVRLPANSLVPNKLIPRPPFNGVKFRPIDFPNLALWLDAGEPSTVQLVSNRVSVWYDRSGNGRNATASSNRPEYRNVNENISIYFSNPNYLTLPAFRSVPITVFMVAANVGSPVENTFFLCFGASSLFFRVLYDTQGNSGDDTFGVDGGGGSYQSGVRDSNTHVWSFVLPASANGTLVFDGTPSTDTTGTTLGANTFFSPNTIGAYSNGESSSVPNAGISEIIIYNRALSIADRQLVEGYLAWKWKNVSRLPVTHPYKSLEVVS